MIRKTVIYCLLLFTFHGVSAQVEWMSFQQLDSALNVTPKPVMIKFVTDWCVYCKKMDKEVFPDQEIIERLNADYYAVSFDAETAATIEFDGQHYEKGEDERYHSMALLLAAKSGEFAPPVTVFLDEEFRVQERIFSYLSRKRLLSKLKKHR